MNFGAGWNEHACGALELREAAIAGMAYAGSETPTCRRLSRQRDGTMELAIMSLSKSTTAEPTFSFGIEEEYYLVDRTTRALAKDAPKRLLAALRKRLGKQFSEEYMRSQVEICTPVCHDTDTARDYLTEYRRSIAAEAENFGLAPIAAATHPFSLWRHQRHRDKPRYNEIAEDFQVLGRRMLVCGQHVHIGIEQADLRIVVMNELRQYLPVLLALSTSSPFWGGETTGLKSYRTAINDSTPRKGIPERFENWAHFQRAVDVLVGAGLIDDASKIWWDIRPSVSFPTLEVRIMDVCPLVDDAICITAILRCLCRYICRTYKTRSAMVCPMVLINENRWRAQRYGIDEGLIDIDTGAIVPVSHVVSDILQRIREDAEYFDCVTEVERARTILLRGTSADRQVALYKGLCDQGFDADGALVGVVDELIADTVAAETHSLAGSTIKAPPEFARRV